MKNFNNPRQFENGALAISVTIDEAPLLKSLVEKLAHRRVDTGYNLQSVPEGWKALDTSSIEAYVSGNMDLMSNGEELSLSYTTCFSFTCIKPAGGQNNLSWINSLS